MTAHYLLKELHTAPTAVLRRRLSVICVANSSNCNVLLIASMCQIKQFQCQVDKSTVNKFCSSKVWTSQIISQAPKVINETDFVVPGVSSSAHEGRRNLTDPQETAQWMGGNEVPEMILKDLIGILPLTSVLVSLEV